MPLKISAQSIASVADERLTFKPTLRQDILLVVAVFEKVGKLSPGVGDMTKFQRELQELLTEAISASGRALSEEAARALDVSAVPALERFALLHFVSAQQALLSSLRNEVANFVAVDAVVQSSSPGVPNRHVKDDVKHILDTIRAIELPFTIAVNPNTFLGAYYRDVITTLSALLDRCQVSLPKGQTLARCIEAAMSEYAAWVASEAYPARAVRSFLNYEQQQQQRTAVIDNVHGLTLALNSWIKTSDASTRRKEKWMEYKATLLELPDDKVTMFDEDFGVRKVFVQPTALYAVAGVKRENPAQVSDVAGLLGTLISDRTSGEDLVLLCGGPGSGKSTLCRVLASELASNDDVHPIFLRLRRLQDSHEIAGFIESQLQQLGLIDKFADLAAIPNLVLILDGFDELVMASRTRLREFFNALKEGLSSGPLRHAKAIVSGRDTLFPKGAGLPIGAHVISLLPFDRPRIEAWASKWRALHSTGEAATFFPENLVHKDKQPNRKPLPLEHLVSWPLTLHLVARAHTSGSINLKPESASQLEKAVLYRSIVSDTALRQEDQAGGRGRLNPLQMRKFVQAIAWEMYSTGREALDVSEGLPILRKIMPGATDSDLAELADVTIVNQPELTRGDETGFEFVHKSFSEYFAAEQIATAIEKVCFQTAQWGSDEKTWAMSVPEATASLASHFAVRLLTAEVQEMVEPMLPDFEYFLRGDDTSKEQTVAALQRKLARLEELVAEFAGGKLLDVVAAAIKPSGPDASPLESFANYASGGLFIAGALARRMPPKKDGGRRVQLSAPVASRLLHIVMAGDVQIDASYASRALTKVEITKGSEADVQFPPIAPVLLQGVQGPISTLERAFADLHGEFEGLWVENLLLHLIVQSIEHRFDSPRRWTRRRYDMDVRSGALGYLRELLGSRARSRVSPDTYDQSRRLFDYVDQTLHSIPEMAREDLHHALHGLRESASRRGDADLAQRIEFVLRRFMEPQKSRRPSKPKTE